MEIMCIIFVLFPFITSKHTSISTDSNKFNNFTIHNTIIESYLSHKTVYLRTAVKEPVFSTVLRSNWVH